MGSNIMKKSLAILIALLALVPISVAGPRIQVPEVHWDFGAVPPNSVVSHAYWVKNIGDDTLRITAKPG
jgi:hypothetical protein